MFEYEQDLQNYLWEYEGLFRLYDKMLKKSLHGA